MPTIIPGKHTWHQTTTESSIRTRNEIWQVINRLQTKFQLSLLKTRKHGPQSIAEQKNHQIVLFSNLGSHWSQSSFPAASEKSQRTTNHYQYKKSLITFYVEYSAGNPQTQTNIISVTSRKASNLSCRMEKSPLITSNLRRQLQIR